MLLKKTGAHWGMRQFRPGRNCRRAGDGGLSTWRESGFKSGRGWVKSLSAFETGDWRVENYLWQTWWHENFIEGEETCESSGV